MKIDGGYILLSRKIDDSDIMRMPPATREIWLYILRKVNHSDYKHLTRGENIFHYKDIQDDLCWYVGYRKMKYSKNDIAKSLRRLCEGNMIDTTKATRGVRIKVLNYSVYQDPKNYEGNTKDTTKATRRTQGGYRKYKNDKNVKNDKKDKKGVGVGSVNILLEEKTIKEFSTQFNLSTSDTSNELNKMVDWLKSKGKVYKDYKAFARNWFRRIESDKPKEQKRNILNL